MFIGNTAGNPFTATFVLTPVAGSTGTAAIEAQTAREATRVDGVNYHAETLNIALGSGDDTFNVQGTNAGTTTHIDLGTGDDRIYISSTAHVSDETAPDFLRGHLAALEGTLNIDGGTGRTLLMVSDEAATVGDTDVLITDIYADAFARAPHVADNAEVFIVGLAQGAVTYRADAAAGNFDDGITVWSGWGDDILTVTGSLLRVSGDYQAITTLNTGLGNDTVTVDLDDGEDGFFVLNTQGPYDDYLGLEDNDTVDASDSTRDLIIFGGQGDLDYITGGSGDDLIFGDRGRVLYFDFDTTGLIEGQDAGRISKGRQRR